MKFSGDTTHISFFLFPLENKSNISEGKTIPFFILLISASVLLGHKFGAVTKLFLNWTSLSGVILKEIETEFPSFHFSLSFLDEFSNLKVLS